MPKKERSMMNLAKTGTKNKRTILMGIKETTGAKGVLINIPVVNNLTKATSPIFLKTFLAEDQPVVNNVRRALLKGKITMPK